MVEVYQLKNQLRLVLVPLAELPSVAVVGMVKTGSRYDKPEKEGLAHFYEHLVFRGTKKYPTKKELALTVDKMGAEYNGATAQEYTFYYVKSAAVYLQSALEIVSQLLVEPLLAEESLDVEKKIILEELHMYEDVPQYKAEMEIMKLLYPRHPLGKTGVGSPRTIERIRGEDFLDFQQNFYTADKTVLVVAGNFPKKEVKKMAENYFAKMKTGEPREFLPVLPIGKVAKKRIRRKTDQVHLSLGGRAFSYFSRERFPQTLLNIILGQGMSSRLFQRIREEAGLAYSVKSEVEALADTGVFLVSAGLNRQKAEKGVKEIRKELKNIKSISQEELAKAKNYFQGQLALSLEDSLAQALFYGKEILLEGKIVEPEKIIEKIKKVKLAEVVEVGEKIFTANNIGEVIVG
ncbi:MAG TPA: pitrilysin family protein [Candidatus Woesebacteria bacterium]|nr:pitrilysin family protein [Candidatus Woesebacteria bacterium]